MLTLQTQNRRQKKAEKTGIEVLPLAPQVKVLFSSLADMLTCGLCKGYLFNAVTITECLHSFCKGCLVHYVNVNLHCPTCRVLIHPTDPLVNIRPDSTIQDILYKLMPDIEEEEKRRECHFYKERGIEFPFKKDVSDSKHRNAVENNRADDDSSANQWLAVILVYAGTSPELESHQETVPLLRNYLWVPGYANIGNFQNFLRKKLSLEQRAQAYLFYGTYLLNENLTLSKINDVFYAGDTNELMTLQYGILPNKNYFLQDSNDYEDEVESSEEDNEDFFS